MKAMDLETQLKELQKANRILEKQLERSEINRTQLEMTNALKEALLRKVIQDLQTSEQTVEEKNRTLKQQSLALERTLQELKQMQAQLIQSEKMSSLGQLVAGVAHEINNPVSFIYGNLNYAVDYANSLMAAVQGYQYYYPHPHPTLADTLEDLNLDFISMDFPKLLSSMQMGAERIQEIVLSLRTFSRLDEAEVKAVDIHDGLDSTLLILANRLKARPGCPAIQVVKDYGHLPPIECYAGKMNQVFMNLLSNAIDALDELRSAHSTGQGNSARTDQEPQQALPLIRIHTERVADHLRICVSDNGPGIPETIQTRIFDPFFTTKPIGKGTGLGLSLSYQIITEWHGGTLKCVATPPQGTEFWIEIPIKSP
jgi:two-component system, NtrC family, sensor kinase